MKTGQRSGTFIATKEHRRFAEFVDAVRKHRYIGLCYGPAGVGKTLSARRYARWDIAENLLTTWGVREESDAEVYAALARSRTVFYTPTVGGTLRELRDELRHLTTRVGVCIEQHLDLKAEHRIPFEKHVEMIVIDEAERLSAQALEVIRDQFDRSGIALILIGMPGIEKSLARYPQLYSRVGFAHHYRPLQGEELTFVLSRHWRKLPGPLLDLPVDRPLRHWNSSTAAALGLTLDDADFSDHQATTAIIRITGGNFRLLHRLFVQIDRVLGINDLKMITADVVEAARSTLVIGAT